MVFVPVAEQPTSCSLSHLSWKQSGSIPIHATSVLWIQKRHMIRSLVMICGRCCWNISLYSQSRGCVQILSTKSDWVCCLLWFGNEFRPQEKKFKYLRPCSRVKKQQQVWDWVENLCRRNGIATTVLHCCNQKRHKPKGTAPDILVSF